MVDLVGIEPTTSSMPWKRAPSCATGPLVYRGTAGKLTYLIFAQLIGIVKLSGQSLRLLWLFGDPSRYGRHYLARCKTYRFRHQPISGSRNYQGFALHYPSIA